MKLVETAKLLANSVTYFFERSLKNSFSCQGVLDDLSYELKKSNLKRLYERDTL